MTEFETAVCGIPCRVRVTEWEPYCPPVLRADPDDSSEEEGGHGTWEILDRNGNPAAWLAAKATDADHARITTELLAAINYQEHYE